jgi:prolyl-tRNA editing enzyme YbaK/EbsC (Cys-tRNA(Pro) deacylase)
MQGTQIEAGPARAIIDWLEGHGVEYELHEHAQAFTAAGAAVAEGVEPATFAKVVGVRTSDGRSAIAVLDATDQVELGELATALGVEWVALLSEVDFAALAPTFEVGTAPPIPELIDAPVYADEAVRDDPKISFPAGSHRHSVRVDRAAWERAAQVGYARFASRRRSIRSLSERGWT